MEDLILVSGCTLVSSWAAAAFVYSTMEAKLSLARRTLSNGGDFFVWGNIREPWSIMTAISTQSVPLALFTRRALIFISRMKSSIHP